MIDDMRGKTAETVGELVAATWGCFGLYTARVERGDRFVWSCYHGHKTRKTALSCAVKNARSIASGAVSEGRTC